MQNSTIEWTDHTFNPWEGCTKVAPGCDHCYAEARNRRFKGGNWGPGGPRRRTSEANWRKPLTWNRRPFFACTDCGWRGTRKDYSAMINSGRIACCPDNNLEPARPRVFCASLADWLDNEGPIEWLADLLDLIHQTPHLDWLLLTKRIGNCMKRLEEAHEYAYGDPLESSTLFDWIDDWLNGGAPHNVWLGATIVNQTEADRDIPKLLDTPAKVRFLSMEPLLGAVDLTNLSYGGWPMDCLRGTTQNTVSENDPIDTVDWVIAGGESGPNARPMHPDWVRNLRDQCQAAGTPFFFKQWGEWRDWSGEDQTDYLYTEDMTEVRFPGLAIHINGTASPRAKDLPSEDKESITQVYRVGKKVAGRTLDGREWNEFPET